MLYPPKQLEVHQASHFSNRKSNPNNNQCMRHMQMRTKQKFLSSGNILYIYQSAKKTNFRASSTLYNRFAQKSSPLEPKKFLTSMIN